jgi:hypothetical protein
MSLPTFQRSVLTPSSGWWVKPGHNQPTKKLTKGRVRRRRETSSLVRFNHSCVRNALLEMVNGAKLKLGILLTLTGLCRSRRPWLVRLRILLIVGDYPNRQLILHPRILVGWFPGSRTQKCWCRFGWRPLPFGGYHFGWRPPWWGGGPCPFSIMSWHSPYNWGKAWKISVRAVERPQDYSSRRLGCLLRDSLGWPAGRRFTSVTRLTSVSPRPAQVPPELPDYGVPRIS